MQINNNGISNNTQANSSQKAVGPTKGQQDSGSGSSASDSVQLSQEALVLKELETKIIASTDVDVSKVDSIRQAIADGNYEIDPDSIANKLLETDDLF